MTRPTWSRYAAVAISTDTGTALLRHGMRWLKNCARPWQTVLIGAGEYVPEGTPLRSAEGQRYRDRVAALVEAGYQAQSKKAAPAGDTVEIVRVVKGSRWWDGRDDEA